MSTYYEFRCPVCGERGGFFSRQTWGWGNANLIENFRFTTWHVRECNAKSLDILSEHDDAYFGPETPRGDLEEGNTDFPHAADWEWIRALGPEAAGLGAEWDKTVGAKLRADNEREIAAGDE